MTRGRTLFVQIIDGDECHQSLLDESGRPSQLRAQPLPRPALREGLGAAARLLERHKKLLRVLARGIYFFPLLLIAKGVMCAVGRPEGDFITVAFVALVLLFFAAMAVYLLLFALAGPPAGRRQGWLLRRAVTVDPGAPGEDGSHLQRLVDAGPDSDEPVNAAQRVRGKARAWSSDEGPLVTDLWSEAGGRVLRVTAARAFTLEREGQPPVVVPADVPLIAAQYQPAEPGADEESLAMTRLKETLSFPTGGEMMRTSVGEGSWLELEVPRLQRVRSLEDLVVDGVGYTPEAGQSSTPYRSGSGQRALMALRTDEQPIVIRPVKQGA